MRTITRLATLSLALGGLLSLPAAAEFLPMATAVPDSVPNGMNYQGRLEKDGFPVSANKAMAFRLYNVATGGTAVYDSGPLTVAVAQGIFAVSLDIPFGALTGTAQKYLELEVDGIVLAPRDPLRSVPYAKVAETVEGTINISTAGLTFTTNVGDSLAISSGSGRVGIGTASPLARLHVSSGAGESGVIVLVSTGASTLVTIDGNGLVSANGVNTGFITVAGTLTVQGNAFSVGGSTFIVSAGRVGIGTLTPGARVTIVGDVSVSSAATFASSVTVAGAANVAGAVGIGTTNPTTKLEVNGDAQFGTGAAKSTFSTTGALSIPGTVSLAVGSTFFVDGANGRVGIGTGSPSASSKLQVLGGDVLIGNPAIHDTTANPDLLVQGNLIIDGKIFQHTGPLSVIEQLGVAVEPQTGQHFSVAYASFNVNSNGNVGIATTTPLAALSVGGNSSFALPATFGSSITVKNAALFGTTGQSNLSATGVLTLGTALSTTSGGTGNTLGIAPTATALTLNPSDAASGFVCRGINALGTCEPAEVDAAAASASTNPVQSGALFTHAALTNPHSATDANTASRIVLRDASGNFSAGTISAALNGNANTATALAANPADAASGRFCRGINASGTCEPGEVDASAVSASTNPLQSGALFTHAALTNPHSATDANTASRIVMRDASGNFSAGTISAAISGNATTATGLAANPSDAASGFVCRGINASGTCEPAEVDAAAASASTNPVQSGALFAHAALTNPHSATDANTASRIVMRDASGNFSAGTITANGVTVPTNGKVVSTGTGPDVTTACGTGAVALAGSTDTAGRVTIGATPPAACVIDFTVNFANAPTCVVSMSNARSFTSVTAVGALTVTSGAFATGDTIDYICLGH